jgi:hypothetical protein
VQVGPWLDELTGHDLLLLALDWLSIVDGCTAGHGGSDVVGHAAMEISEF